MLKSQLFAAALIAVASSTEVIFKTGAGAKGRDYRSSDYKMSFRWPSYTHISRDYKNYYRCTATMITPRIAITAAHCVGQGENRVWETRSERLRARVAGKTMRIQEIRVPECWDLANMGPFPYDVALLIFDRDHPEAVKGYNYINLYDPAEVGDLRPETEFTVAGYGRNGPWNVRNDELQLNDLNTVPRFRRGWNNIGYFSNNLMYFTLDKDALVNEAGGSFGDSGSGALVEVENADGTTELQVAGVLSHKYVNINSDGSYYLQWGALQAYTRTEGAALDWIKANIENYRPGQAVSADNCEDWPYANTQQWSQLDVGQTPDLDVDQFDYDTYGDPVDGYFHCEEACDCEEGDLQCTFRCDACRGDGFVPIQP